jgi:hypothetical protein
MCRLTLMGKTFSSPFSLIILSLLSGCSECNGGSSGGGITIAQSDGTPPTATLQVAQLDGQDVSVKAGGSAQTMKLTKKTGVLNVAATAKDVESGVQALEIWVNKKTSTCDAAGMCTNPGFGLLGPPRYRSTVPKKNPGETAVDASILADALDLTKEIPQGALPAGNTRTVELVFFAKARNHLGDEAQTPELKATWSEP